MSNTVDLKIRWRCSAIDIDVFRFPDLQKNKFIGQNFLIFTFVALYILPVPLCNIKIILYANNVPGFNYVLRGRVK